MRRADGDTLLVWDELLDRVSVFAPGGDYVRSTSLAQVHRTVPHGTLSALLGHFPDGALLMSVERIVTSLDARSTDTLVLVRVSADGSTVDSLGAFDGNEQVRVRDRIRPSLLVRWILPYGKNATIRVHNGTIYTQDGTSPEVRLFDRTGSLEAIWRGGVQPFAVTRADWEQMTRDSASFNHRRYDDSWQAALRTVGPPETAPAFRRIFLADTGHVWAEHSRAPTVVHATWTVFDSTGSPVHSVRADRSLRLLDIRAGNALAYQLDELGVESLRVYPLVPRTR